MAPARLRLTFASLVALAGWLAPATTARGQIAFAPNVSSFPNGVTLNATPVVSADRRYVRLTLNPIFNSLEGLDTYPVPFAVSGGGGAGGGGLGGIGGGGLGGGIGGGAGGAGFRNMTVAAGMNGVVGPGNPFAQGPSVNSAFASDEASAVLSGNAAYGYAPSPANDGADPTPPRPRVSRKAPRNASPKKASPPKRR